MTTNFDHQPLHLPPSWVITYNNALYAVDPCPDMVPEEDRWWVFKEDMLQVRHQATDTLLDLGWSPEGDLEEGGYCVTVCRPDFRGRILHQFQTRDRQVLVREIERITAAIDRGEENSLALG